MPKKKFILQIFLSLVALAMFTGVAAVLLPSRWIGDDVMLTILVVGSYSLGGLIVVVLGGTKGIDGSRQRWTLGISTTALFISLGLFITAIWVGWRWDDIFFKAGAAILTIGITFVHRLVVLPLRCNYFAFRFNKLLALMTGALTGTLVVTAVITDGFGRYDDPMLRILSISAIITAGDG